MTISTTNQTNDHDLTPPPRLDDPTDLIHSLDTITSIPDFLNACLSRTSSLSTTVDAPNALDLITSDHLVSTVLTQLGILTSDTSHQLERSIHEISRTVPRLTYDLQYMRQSAEGVRSGLEGVQMRFKVGSTRGASPTPTTTATTPTTILDKLTHLETLRTNLSNARSVLQETESWSTLSSEYTLYLSRGQYRRAARRLTEARSSLDMFQRGPRGEYEWRKGVWVDLQEGLESELDGVLERMLGVGQGEGGVRGDGVGDGERTRSTATPIPTPPTPTSDEKEQMDLPGLLDIFRLIDREDEYRLIYFNARRREITRLWTEVDLVELASTTNNPTNNPTTTTTTTTHTAESFPTFLPRFYTSFLSLLRTESTSIRKIFSHHPVIVLSTFFQTTLEALQPSFGQRLEEVAEYYRRRSATTLGSDPAQIHNHTKTRSEGSEGKSELDVLLTLWNMTVGFGKDVQDILDGLFYATHTSGNGGANPQGSERVMASPAQMVVGGSPTTLVGTNHSRRRSRSGSIVQPLLANVGSSGSAGGVTTTTAMGEKRSSSRRFSRSFGTVGTSSALAGMIPEVEPISSSPAIFPTIENLTGAWDTILYEPFLPFQTDYLQLEKRNLTLLLKSESIFIEPAFLVGRSPGERLSAKGSRVIEMAEEALNRCTSFTLGFGLTDLLEAVTFLVEMFLRDAKELLELKRGVGDVKNAAVAVGKSSSAGGYTRDSLDELDDLADLDLDMDGMGNDELVTFKLGLGVLRTCSKLKSRIEQYSVKVDSAVALTSRSLSALAQGTALAPESYLAGVTKGAPILLKQSTLHQLALVRLLDGQPSIEELRPAQKAVIEYTRDAQAATQRAIVAPIQALLVGYPSLPSWAQPDKVARRGELHVPTFSLSPTDIISTVTERLLDLLRLFEGFANDDGFAFSLGTLPHVNLELLQKMTQAAQQEAQAPAQHHRTISNVGAFAGMNEKLGLVKSPTPTSPSTESSLPAEVILSTWVSSTTSSLLDNFTAKILPEIKQPLTSHGATQLATDLSYLGNATRAMDVESQHLECWRESCETKSVVELKELIARETYTARSPEAVDIARYIAWLRGWTLD